jgi:hypothetical protein
VAGNSSSAKFSGGIGRRAQQQEVSLKNPEFLPKNYGRF